MRQRIFSLVFLIPLVMLLSLSVMAQEKTITGTVRSSNGNAPLESVTITVVGTKKSTLTDANGSFSITASTTASGQLAPLVIKIETGFFTGK